MSNTTIVILGLLVFLAIEVIVIRLYVRYQQRRDLGMASYKRRSTDNLGDIIVRQAARHERGARHG